MKHRNIYLTSQGYYLVAIRRVVNGREVRVNQNFRTLDEAIAARDAILKRFEETGEFARLTPKNKLHNIFKYTDKSYRVDIRRVIDGKNVVIVEDYRRLEDAITARDHILKVYEETGKLLHYREYDERLTYKYCQARECSEDDIVLFRDHRNNGLRRAFGFYCKNCQTPVKNSDKSSRIYRSQMCKKCRDKDADVRSEKILQSIENIDEAAELQNIIVRPHRYDLQIQRNLSLLLISSRDLERIMSLRDHALAFYDKYRRLPSRKEVLEAERDGKLMKKS